jgi:predicted ArsR family transcriptional regulator
MSNIVVGANSERSRSHNRQVVLGRVRAAGEIGRAEIARASGLSTQAVSNIIAELLEDGFIVERGRRTAGRGLPAAQYALNPGGGFALGIEIRPDAVFAALLNLCGARLAAERRAIAAPDRESVTQTVRALHASVLGTSGMRRRTGFSARASSCRAHSARPASATAGRSCRSGRM